ncbi:MAG TPA: helix-turn-helix domain-containing protein [Acidimicrobiales bacterium]|nr:helix-turn-helix domain-containing protein [Acidimicrobiales bacterium]
MTERPPVRRITDAVTMRALAHPVRLSILEVLGLSGPLTATEVGERIGESPTTCSFHLRQLAKYGFVEEAGGGKGRARPWRMTGVATDISAGDPEAEIASNALTSLVLARHLEWHRRWVETRSSYPERWRRAANESSYVAYLTVDELEQLNERISDLFLGLGTERLTDPSKRPAGSVPVDTVVLSFPLAVPDPERDPEAGP